jgi:hypothetical protein
MRVLDYFGLVWRHSSVLMFDVDASTFVTLRSRFTLKYLIESYEKHVIPRSHFHEIFGAVLYQAELAL